MNKIPCVARADVDTTEANHAGPAGSWISIDHLQSFRRAIKDAQSAAVAAAAPCLKIGDRVKVIGTKQADGSILATRIDVLPAATGSSEVVFDGTIDKITQDRSIIVVRGTTVLVSSETKIQAGEKLLKLADLKLGDVVKIKGLKQPDGTVTALLVVVVLK